MNFKIISIGKFPKSSPYIKMFEEYRKRVRYKVELIEVKNEDEEIKNFNLQRNIINKNSNSEKEIIILDKNGKDIDSEDFSKLLEKKINRRYKELIFFIGGPNGIHSSIIKSNLSLSFGNQTWPHLLVRVMLIEQIYRALAILQGHPYHK